MVGSHQPLPFDGAFRVADALDADVGRGRLRGSDLLRPYRGVRMFVAPPDPTDDPWLDLRNELRWLAESYRPLLLPTHAITGDAALAIWGAPLFTTTRPVLDVTVQGDGPLPRRRGVRAHRAPKGSFPIGTLYGIATPPAPATWALLAAQRSVEELVIVGDYFCRMWREGYGRRSVGRDPITTINDLEAETDARRRVGVGKLRKSLPLIRSDAWSPRETKLRLILQAAGLPEPELNLDVWEGGVFLGCGDICYPQYKVLVEYHGQQHGAQYAHDVERNAAFRAAGWDVIEVTSASMRRPNVVVARTATALRARGWCD